VVEVVDVGGVVGGGRVKRGDSAVVVVFSVEL
jgi:hypothetical protein